MSVRGSLQEKEIGEHLGGLAAHVEVARPDWESVRGGVRRVRRRRRLVRVGKGAGSVVAVAALAGALQAGVLPYPSWAPAVPVSSTDGASLADRPVQGSLAGDEVWLDAFRAFVPTLHDEESGGEDWRVPSAGDVDVIYAGDVGGTRLVLAQAPYRWGLIEQPRQVWFEGGRGAGPAELFPTRDDEPSDLAVAPFGLFGQDATELGVVVVATGDRAVDVQERGVLEADGSVTRERTSLRTGDDGVLEWVAPDQGPYEVTVEGSPVPWVVGEQYPQVETVTWNGQGARVDPEVVRSGGQAGVTDLALTAASAEQLWGAGGEPGAPVLVSVPASSGAALLVLGRVAEPIPWRTPEWTDPPAMSVDVRRTLPAGQEPVLAWQVGETVWSHQGDGDSWGDADETWYPREGASGTVAFVGPAAAVRADVLSEDGRVLRSVALAGGGGVAGADGAARVRFLDADGAEVGSADVVPWTEDGATAEPGR